ncbi:MAG: class I SAM-dependent methyltransferase [Candidatus Kapaibacterium sp.]|jgi:ubiquinone/menaquinone biosynthesis C-methylase UbiE
MAHVHEFLRSHLVDPQTRTSPASWSDDAVIFDDGSSYAIVDGIPVMLAHTDGSAHYREHYATDAQAFDYFEERDAATDHDEHRLRQTILRQVPPNTASVLDVGCGRAWVARALSVQSSLVCSLDVSITNPRKALQAIPNNNHCAVVADAFALPFADGTFDCVVSSEVIEHVPDPTAFLKELLRVLKPGGRCIISTPYNERRKFVLCIHCNNVTPLHAHLHSFTEHTMQQLSPSTTMSYEIFGNKALLHLRTYVLLRFLPYALWRVVDAIANSLINKCSHIVCVYSKRV